MEKLLVAMALLTLAAMGAMVLYMVAQEPEGPTIGAYYLMNLDPAKIQWHYWTVLVMEPDEATEDVMAAGLDNSDLLLAYINAGYAEEWRSYWPEIANASWVHEPAEYEGEYYIEYWNPQWRDILEGVAHSYLQAGFEGVYLDNVDAAEIIDQINPQWAAGVDTYQEMVNLVCNVSGYVKSLSPQYKVYINIGGAYYLLYDEALLSCIDGVLREELWTIWTGVNQTAPQDPQEIQDALDALQHAHAMGKAIMIADPARTSTEAEQLCTSSWSHGFIPVPQPAWAPDYEIPPLAGWCTGQAGQQLRVELTANATSVAPGSVVRLGWLIEGAEGWVTNVPGAGVPGVDTLILSPLEENLSMVSMGVDSVLGYMSLTTVGGWEPWAGNVTSDMIIGYTSWGDAVVNVSDPRWVSIVLEEAVPYILFKGFSGVMLDNLDMVDAYPELYGGIVSLVQLIDEAYPNISIVVNRGFTVLPDIAGRIDGLLFEAYGSYYDFATSEYKPYTGQDLEWINNTLRATMQLAQEYGFKVLGLAYGDPGQPSWEEILDTVCSLNEPYNNPVYITDVYLGTIGVVNPCGGAESFIVYYGPLEAVMQQAGSTDVSIDRDTVYYIYAWNATHAINKTLLIQVEEPPQGSVEIEARAVWPMASIHSFQVTLEEPAAWTLKVKIADGEVIGAWGAVLEGFQDGYYILSPPPLNTGARASGGIVVGGDKPLITEALLVVDVYIAANWTLPPGNLTATIVIDSDWGSGYQARITLTNIGPGPVMGWYVVLNTSSKITSIWGGNLEDLGGGLIQVTPAVYTKYIPPGGTVEVGFITEKRGPNPYPEIVEYG